MHCTTHKELGSSLKIGEISEIYCKLHPVEFPIVYLYFLQFTNENICLHSAIDRVRTAKFAAGYEIYDWCPPPL